MASKPWQEMALGDFVTLQRGHDLPDTRRRPGRIPVMGSFGPTGYHDEPKTKGPGITVGRRSASFGVVNYCSVDYWPLNTALYVTDFHGNDERFAYYLLKTIDFTAYNSGSAQPSLNRNFIHPLRIRVPAPNEQRRIANILGTLDDKIELNRRMNETLEAMARRLFKSWFIDFDPVHAKAALRREHPKLSNADLSRRALPNMAPEIAELFPDSFVDSTHGAIPKGWKAGAVGDIGDNPRRGVKPSDIQAATPNIALEHMPRRCIALSEWGTRTT
ncbi:MAG: restriction endonuclease subunit S [Planctomycetaceae bacterium]